MRTAHCILPAIVLGIWLGSAAGLRAESGNASDASLAPATGPMTLWSFLGIPQGINKVRDATINRRGNRPQWERKPPLKQIADPENLKSPNAAIQAAAKAKAEADLAPQKIKAIKYLATYCCGCPANKEEIKNALLAALSDCTEEVRYQAALALCECAGNPCTICNQSTCCAPDVMNKLADMAEGKDDKGCWKESSPRVRGAAQNALDACKNARRPTAEPAPGPERPEEKERPLTPAAPGGAPAVAPPAPQTPTPAPAQDEEELKKKKAAPSAQSQPFQEETPVSSENGDVKATGFTWTSDMLENPAEKSVRQPKAATMEDTRSHTDMRRFAARYR